LSKRRHDYKEDRKEPVVIFPDSPEPHCTNVGLTAYKPSHPDSSLLFV